jgi:hypothetical protein
MRTAPGFDAQNAVLRQRSPAREKLGILLGKDVIGDHRQAHVITQTAAERFDKRRLSRPHRPTDTDDGNVPCPSQRGPTAPTEMFVFSMHGNRRADG